MRSTQQFSATLPNETAALVRAKEVLRETIRDIQARNFDADPAELERLIDEEVSGIRSSFWGMSRQ